MVWTSRDRGTIDHDGTLRARELKSTKLELGHSSDDVADDNLSIVNGGTGDAKIKLTAGAQTYVIGIDNSQGDRLNISNGSNLDATQGIVIDSANRIGVGGTSSTAALITLTSTTRGFLPSQMTAAQMLAISTPPAGLIVYNSTSAALCIFIDGVWRTLQSSLANFV